MKFSTAAVAAALFLLTKTSFGFTTPSFVKRQTTNKIPIPTLFGILDELNSDQYDLAGSSSDSSSTNLNDQYEIFLGELVFSANDPRIDIMNNYERAVDDDWLEWLDKKVQSSRDPEERIALRDLHDMILDLKKRVELSRLQEERERRQEAERARIIDDATAETGRAMSNAEVLKKATELQAPVKRKSDDDKEDTSTSFFDQDLTPEIRLSYQDLLKKVLPPYPSGTTPASIVFAYYDQFDAQFVKVLTERSTNGDDDSAALLKALSQEQGKRLSSATETLKKVLALGEPMRMEGSIVKLAREGKIDEPFLLLLEANVNQAKNAGATGPAQLMERLRKRAEEEKDKQVTSKEIRLIRQLLRTDDPKQRETILEEAFTPKEALIVPGTTENAQKAVDGEQPEQEKPMPDVPPPDFINACKAVTLNFGNVAGDADRGDLASRIKQIAAEAEVVATRIYGQGMTPRDQQDRAWKEQTTSIFDLERMEIEAEQMGDRAPWTNPDADDDMFLPGFDNQGRMQVGGG